MALKHQVETTLFRLIAGLLRRLPEKGAFSLAEGVVLFAHRVCGWRRASTQERVAEVFPGKSPQEVKATRLEAVRNLARNITELVRGPSTFTGTIEGEMELINGLRKGQEGGKGVLLVIVHSGNWDFAGVKVCQHDVPMCFIARQQKNTELYQELINSREEGGGTVVDRDDPRLMRKLLTYLKEENGVVAILVDIRSRTAVDTFRYLNHDANLANGLGLLAAKSGAAVVPLYMGRRGRKTHIWKTFPARTIPEEESKNKELRAEILQYCLDTLTAEILQNPESYFWFNKRWVLEPHKEE